MWFEKVPLKYLIYSPGHTDLPINNKCCSLLESWEWSWVVEYQLRVHGALSSNLALELRERKMYHVFLVLIHPIFSWSENIFSDITQHQHVLNTHYHELKSIICSESIITSQISIMLNCGIKIFYYIIHCMYCVQCTFAPGMHLRPKNTFQELFLPCGSRELNSGHQLCELVPFRTGPS